MRVRFLSTFLFVVVVLSLVVVIAPRIVQFAKLFSTHAGPALTQEDIETAYNSTVGDATRKQWIPKIIHQVFHNWKQPGNQTIPTDWEAVRQTCVAANPDWEYHLWTEESSLEFITIHYGWFLSTYEAYPHPVQKIDALRYFLMLHYGGIYIDLDNGCSRDLQPLLYYPAFVTDGGQGTLSNNILGARPGHPYWQMMTDALIPWSYDYLFPYFTISHASGQWFETAIWEQYHAQLPDPPKEDDMLYRMMMDMRPGGARWVFFTQGRGGSWDNWDNHLFSYIGNVLIPWVAGHIVYLALGVVVIIGLLWYRRRRAKRRGYKTVPGDVV